MCSSCCSNPAWLQVPSAVLRDWFTPNTLLLNHSFARNHPYKVYIKMLPVLQFEGSCWKDERMGSYGGYGSLIEHVHASWLLVRGGGSRPKGEMLRSEHLPFLILPLSGSSREAVGVDAVPACRHPSQRVLVLPRSPRASEGPVLLGGGSRQARQQKGDAGRSREGASWN